MKEKEKDKHEQTETQTNRLIKNQPDRETQKIDKRKIYRQRHKQAD